MSNITLTEATIENLAEVLSRHLGPAIEDHGTICDKH